MAPRVNTEDLVDTHGVAELLGLSHPNSVFTYLKRYDDFPKPVLDFGSHRAKLWRRHDVEEWSRRR